MVHDWVVLYYGNTIVLLLSNPTIVCILNLNLRIQFVSIVPIVEIYTSMFQEESGLSMFGHYVTWTLMVISGFFFALGSLAFARACEGTRITSIEL